VAAGWRIIKRAAAHLDRLKIGRAKGLRSKWRLKIMVVMLRSLAEQVVVPEKGTC